ncbi:leucine-rich repeat-containing protein 37A-like [Melanerpes formicivorus]|uniref:leucine-rich repeat-containing protein 37A-like n=1 Tax=Melanerpes formicivorus TaxID=211600 RepID=UPI00358E5B59
MEAVEGVGDAEGAESPRQDHVWTPRGHKRRHSRALPDPQQPFYGTPGKVQPEEEPPAREGMPHTAGAHWKQEEEGSSVPNKPGGSHSPGREAAGGDLLEAAGREELRSPVPERALRGALRGARCSLPQLRPACAQLLLQTGLLIKLLSQRQAKQAASVPAGQCGLQGNVSVGLAREEKAKNTFRDSLLLGLAVFVVVMINLLVICLVEVHSRKRAAASHPQSSRKSVQRGCFRRLLPRGWSKSKDGDGEDSPVWNPTQTQPQWLQDLFEPLDPQQERAMAQLCMDSSDEEIFSRPQAQFLCWKSRGGQEVPPPGVPGALPHVPSTPQQLAPGSGCPEEGAGGSPVLGGPQSSSQ